MNKRYFILSFLVIIVGIFLMGCSEDIKTKDPANIIFENKRSVSVTYYVGISKDKTPFVEFDDFNEFTTLDANSRGTYTVEFADIKGKYLQAFYQYSEPDDSVIKSYVLVSTTAISKSGDYKATLGLKTIILEKKVN